MSTAKRFEDLEIWQLARTLVKDIYSLTNGERFSRDFAMKDQIRRAAIGVMNNISEGFESRTVKMFIEYLGRSKASCGETRSMLYAALDQDYLQKDEFEKLVKECTKISSKTLRLMKYLDGYDSNNRVQETIVHYE